MNRGWLYAWLNLFSYVAMLVVNGLANALPIGGRTTGQISAMFPVLVTPASYAFSIWGLIYLLLGLFVFSQVFVKWRNEPVLEKIGPWFLASSVFNIMWILLWHHVYIVSSVFMMLALLLALITIYQRIRWEDVNTPNVADRFLIYLPFSVYLGWISVASIVNISVALSSVGWRAWGLSESTWAVIVMVLAALLTVWMASKYRDIAFVLTVVWALIAIGVNQTGLPVVSWTAWLISLGLIILVVLRTFFAPTGQSRHNT